MDQHVANLKKIVLELAREPGHPHGDSDVRYTLVAPLDGDGRLDAEAWRAAKDRARVVREAPGEETAAGHIVHGPGGRWTLTYDIDGKRADEIGFQFDKEKFVPGEYISIQSGDDTHVYKVILAQAV